MSESSATGGTTTVEVDSDVLQEIKRYKLATSAQTNREAIRHLLPPYGSEDVDIDALEELAAAVEQVEENRERIESIEADQETYWAAVNDLRKRVTDVEDVVEE